MAGYRMAGVRTPCIVASATAVNASSMHGTAAIATTASASNAATATTAGEGVVRHQCREKQHDRCEQYKSTPHDIPPYDLVPMLSMELRVRAATRRRNEGAKSTQCKLSRLRRARFEINQRNS
jgi:hypothetical protein